MIAQAYAQSDSVIHRLDPRGRIVLAVALAILLAVSTSPSVQWVGLAIGLGVTIAARLPARVFLKNMARVNVFMLFLWLLLPVTHAGTPIGYVGPLALTREGVRLALAITLKCNGIVMIAGALMGTVDIVRLGHALHHLRVPAKLVHLLLFTVRYFDVLAREYGRLRAAMKVRCFRPATNRHTYRTYGYLIGMLLVRSLDRSGRVVDAMKCRGFRGRFYLYDHFRFAAADLWFALGGLLALAALGYLQWAMIL